MRTVSLNCPMLDLTFPGFGDLVAESFLHTEHLMPFTAALASSLPPESRTILSNSTLGGCPELKCSLRTLDKSALGILPCISGGRSNSIPPSGISVFSSKIAKVSLMSGSCWWSRRLANR